MKAEDTVLKELVYDSGLVIKFSITDREIAEAQAEISFKAGIKEVVEWINKNCDLGECDPAIVTAEWQAKLKD